MTHLFYVPCSTHQEALFIGRKLVEEKLVACISAYPSTSIYWWKGKLCQSDEGILICKTTAKMAKKVEKRIMKLHSYDLPAILKIQAKANTKYDQWVKESVKARKVVKRKVRKKVKRKASKRKVKKRSKVKKRKVKRKRRRR